MFYRHYKSSFDVGLSFSIFTHHIFGRRISNYYVNILCGSFNVSSRLTFPGEKQTVISFEMGDSI
jgi:hypothetical protein